MGYESVQLFVERAQAVQKSFGLTAGNAPAVAQICAQLQGIPLAIELAAARVSVLSVAQIAARLDDHLSLLTGRKVAPCGIRRCGRRWTGRMTCSAIRSRPFSSVFPSLPVAGAWTPPRPSARATGLATAQVLDLLASLTDKSLILFEPADQALFVQALSAGEGASSRYRLLETVRQYAAERLVTSGEAESRPASASRLLFDTGGGGGSGDEAG